MSTTLVRGGRVIDPANKVDAVADLWLKDGLVVGLGPQPRLSPDATLDAKNLVVCPGLIDMHVHLREPGREEDETIETGTAAAVAGGVTAVACMPNTEPPIDRREVADLILAQARKAGHANVYPIGTITHERKGEKLSALLQEGG